MFTTLLCTATQAPCQHNFCLKCFQDLVAKSNKKACPSCRHPFGGKFAENPRINTALTVAIRAVKAGKPAGAAKSHARRNNDERPEEAYRSERAQRAGMANAASGRIMVNVPNDHFGPIPASADPRGTGVQVGEYWRDRLHCRQWGAHFPHVAGIAGQSNVGAQSVVLSGGYEDDKDEGEWFLYTGSGGRDLSGNKRTNKIQSFDQEFENMNKALQTSCLRGLPVRVVRSYKEKRSSFAPPEEIPVRYDGIYRIVKCWRKKGKQGLLMCRYLFIRCDNEPAPWSSEETGDKPLDLKNGLPAEALKEMKAADKGIIYSMEDSPYWDWNEAESCWGWTRPPPESQRSSNSASVDGKPVRKRASEQEKALREMTCGICKNVLVRPVSAPCSHAFCKPCLDTKFGDQAFEVGTGVMTGRSMRIRKVPMPCPCKGCTADLGDFLKTAQVNRDMESLVQKLLREVAAARSTEAGETDAAKAGLSQDIVASQEDPSLSSPLHRVPSHRILATESNAGAVVGRFGPSMGPTEGEQRALATATLSSEFPEFDASLISVLIEQEEGDAKAVRVALARMRRDMQAEQRKRAKMANATAESNGTTIEEIAMGSQTSPPAAGGKRGGSRPSTSTATPKSLSKRARGDEPRATGRTPNKRSKATPA